MYNLSIITTVNREPCHYGNRYNLRQEVDERKFNHSTR